MKKILLNLILCAASIMGAIECSAQTQEMIGTIAEPSGQQWGYATVTFELNNPPGGPLTSICPGVALVNKVVTTISSVGGFIGDVPLFKTSCISPAGATWTATIQPAATTPPQKSRPFTLTGAAGSNFDFGALVSPQLSNIHVAMPQLNASGYNVNEITGMYTSGATFYLSVADELECFNIDTDWGPCAGDSAGGITQLTGDTTTPADSSGSTVATAVNLPGHIPLTGAAPVAGQVVTATSPTNAVWGNTKPVPVFPYPNGPNGTTDNLLACWTQTGYAQTQIQTCTTAQMATLGTDGNNPIVGVVVAGAGTTGTADVQQYGAVPWTCDGTIVTVANGGYWVEPSTTVAGECHQPSGSFPPAPNENPEGNTVLGFPITANIGAGSIAGIVLSQSPYYNQQGLLMSVGSGSGYTSVAHITQDPSTAPIPFAVGASGLDVQLRAGFNGNFLFGRSTNGASGQDISVTADNNAMMDEFTSTYHPPSNVLFGGGQYYFQNFGHSLDVGGTTGYYQIQVSSSMTAAATLTDDNAGHLLIWTLQPPSTGGPFTFAFPTNVTNPPTVSLSAGDNAKVVGTIYDGSTYWCAFGCS